MAKRRRLDGGTVPQPDDVGLKASPKIKQTKLEKIRPTQMSVGFVEVAKIRRRRRWPRATACLPARPCLPGEARDFPSLVLDEFWVVMDHLQ